jgi:hypothetical protein
LTASAFSGHFGLGEFYAENFPARRCFSDALKFERFFSRKLPRAGDFRKFEGLPAENGERPDELYCLWFFSNDISKAVRASVGRGQALCCTGVFPHSENLPRAGVFPML